MNFRIVLVVLVLLHCSACATVFGPRSLERSRQPYNEALARTQSEQLLLNVVRLRYRDTPLFLKVGTLTTQFNFRTDAGANSELSYSGGDSFIGPFFGYSFEERPTVTYTPLQGDEFAKHLLKPLTIDSLVLLSSGGWSIERIFLVAAQGINGVKNAKTAGGPTPLIAPSNEDFREVCALFRILQQRDALRWYVRKSGERESLALKMSTEPAVSPHVKRLRELLNLSQSKDGYNFGMSRYERSRTDIAVTTRSLLSVLFFLSQAVHVPPEHEQHGLVTVTRKESSAQKVPFEWSQVLGDIFSVSHAEKEPLHAWPRVRYRNHWFYIEQSDLSSKSTFMLLSQLLSLQSSGVQSISPALTLAVGG